VQGRYGFAPSPGQVRQLRKTYRTTDRRIPWFVRACEGKDAETAAEVDALAAANVLRQNTVILHGTGLRPEDAPRLAEARACVVWCPETDLRLYGATASVAALVAAGVRIGLGSDSAAAGSRDASSNLAAARGQGVVGDDELLRLASEGSGEVARLPVGGFTPGAVADFVVVDSRDGLLGGDRKAFTLTIVAGRPLCGTPEHMKAAGVASARLRLEGEERALEASLFRRLRAILRRHPAALRASWLERVEFPDPSLRADAV
jgi:cytosine/adenosine deaminase-related metal-dependent hydrolase